MSQVFTPGPDVVGGEHSPLTKSVHSAVCDRLRSDILRGRIPGGTRLQQAELAKEYGVSVTPVREALRDLASEGLVDLTAYSGAVTHQPTIEELEQVYDIRAHLIPLSVREGVARITDRDIDAIEQLLETMTHAGPERWLEGNRRLHNLFDEASRNSRLTAILRRLGDLSTMYVNISLAPDQGDRNADAEHRALLEAYRARDEAAAVRLSLQHFGQTLELSRARLLADTPEERR